MEGACGELSLINLSCLIPFPTGVVWEGLEGCPVPLGYRKEKQSVTREHREGLWTPGIVWEMGKMENVHFSRKRL